MPSMKTSREYAKLLNTLTILLKGLQGKVTTIELRNESSIRGRIDSVDYLMNTTLTDAVVVAPDGRQLKTCEEFFVQGKNIRYVHIPDDVNIIKTIEEQVKSITPAAPTARKPKPTAEEKKRDIKQEKKKKLDSAIEAMKAQLANSSKP